MASEKLLSMMLPIPIPEAINACSRSRDHKYDLGGLARDQRSGAVVAVQDRPVNKKEHGPSITGLQCQLARKLLKWSRRDLAIVSGIDAHTIAAYERGSRTPHTVTVHSLYHAFEMAGVEFILKSGGGAVIRLKELDH